MVLTNERAEMLAKYLTDNKDKALDILEMDAGDAVAKINADGYDFTVEELNEFASALENNASNGELDEGALDDVAGGVLLTPCIAVAVAAAAAIGYSAAKRSKKVW